MSLILRSYHIDSQDDLEFKKYAYKSSVSKAEYIKLLMKFGIKVMDSINKDGEVSLKELETCDVYVGVIGRLYGSCPSRRVLSYTELEYKRARELGKYQIILVIGDGAQITFDQIEQNPKKIERINRFRERIQRSHTVDYFDNEDEVAWKILAALRIYEIRLSEEQQGLGGNS